MERRTAQQRRIATRPTCLVVEDSTFDQQRIARILNHSFRDLQVSVAATLDQARAALVERPVALLLLDNNLPDGYGADFAVELSDDPRFRDIPIVIVSDWPTPFMFHKAERAGVRHVVTKSDFGARYVHAALDRRRSVQRRLN